MEPHLGWGSFFERVARLRKHTFPAFFALFLPFPTIITPTKISRTTYSLLHRSLSRFASLSRPTRSRISYFLSLPTMATCQRR